MNKTHIKFFRTADFEKALILRSAEAVLSGVEWNDSGSMADFLFEDEPTCLAILDKHKRRHLKLNSADVLVAHREIKNELFHGR